MPSPRRLALLLLLTGVLAACGDAEGPRALGRKGPAIAAAPPVRGVTPDTREAARAIRGWSEALRRSDVSAAADFFARPSVVDQGVPRVLRSRDDVEAFNDGLPCGARLVSVQRIGAFVVGTFELGERPGHACDAPGASARVATLVRDGKLTEWRQLPDPAPDPGAIPAGPGQSV